MAWRVNAVEAVCEDGYGGASGVKGGAVRDGIDADGQSADDGGTGGSEFARDLVGNFFAIACRPAAANNGNHGVFGQSS